ncbi:MAG: DUF111 family protein [Saprospiraceae bacterium]|nr:DUF111 family protein [Saprospiraceae bacterium]
MLETNIDDSSSELLGMEFQNGLIENGAIDFFLSSILMKKGRPGFQLSALVNKEDLHRLGAYILEHTTSIGLRYYPLDRIVLERNQFELETPFGVVSVKEVETPSGSKRYKIEHESLQNLKELHNISILRLQEEIYPLILKNRQDEKERQIN